ncbi:hypothetical protein Tco_0097937 [Tanacetum coccineum]
MWWPLLLEESFERSLEGVRFFGDVYYFDLSKRDTQGPQLESRDETENVKAENLDWADFVEAYLRDSLQQNLIFENPDIATYVSKCLTCAKSKRRSISGPAGLLLQPENLHPNETGGSGYKSLLWIVIWVLEKSNGLILFG